MKEVYYRSLYWSLSQLKNALPSSLESAEREAVLRRIHLLQNQIQAQIQELNWNDPRHPGL